MKKLIYKVTNILLILCLLPNYSFSQEPPRIEQVSGAVEAEQTVALPDQPDSIARARARDEAMAPTWVKELLNNKIRDYFPVIVDEAGRQRLLSDTTKLHRYFDAADLSGQFKGFVAGKLTPKILGLKDAEVLSAVGDWTLEELVIKEQLGYLGRQKNFVRRALELITGPHLRGATRKAGLLVVGAVATYMVFHFGVSADALGLIGRGWRAVPGVVQVSGVAIGSFLLGSLRGGFNAGVVGPIIGSGTSWFLQPTNEFIRVFTARYTGKLEARINNFYDKLKPAVSSGAKAEERNHSPKIATEAEDNFNVAAMSAKDQESNWNKSLSMWIAVAKRFNQLLRDTHHAGRVLMMISWSDEQLTTNLVETMESKLISLRMMELQLLSSYKTAFMIRGESEKYAAIEQAFDDYKELALESLMNMNLDKIVVDDIFVKILTVKTKLALAGVSTRDLNELADIQPTRARAVGTIVTALGLNEIRSFGVAEANRNLETEARLAQRSIRRGFHLQFYVNQYLGLVQNQIRDMGYTHSGTAPVIAGKSCVRLFDGLSH